MDIIEDIQKYCASKCKSNKSEEWEKGAVEYIQTLDFKNIDARKSAEEYIQYILADYFALNKEITTLQAKVMHALITKMTLDKLGLNNIKINYENRKEGNYAEAYYRPNDDSLHFFNQNVCNPDLFLKPYSDKVDLSEKSRLGFFAKQIFVINHEIQHAVQWKMLKDESIDKNNISSENLIISKQGIARTLVRQYGTKYFKNGLDPERLYKENHDKFYYEIEADMFGFDRTLQLLVRVSQKFYNLVKGANYNYLEKFNNRKNQLENYSFVMWKHDTNPNNMEVSANHKASLIIDTVLPN